MEDRLRYRPTAEQYRAFADYLPEAHSWYKHLPLIEGGRFVVFVSPDAGIGRLVARMKGPDPESPTGYSLEAPQEGPEFTEEHPRLHYGWQTTKEYRQRFGYLDYMYRHSADDKYSRDVASPVSLPNSIEDRCSFVMFPYACWTFSEAILWHIHDESLQKMRAGASHPARESILELADLAVQEIVFAKLGIIRTIGELEGEARIAVLLRRGIEDVNEIGEQEVFRLGDEKVHLHSQNRNFVNQSILQVRVGTKIGRVHV